VLLGIFARRELDLSGPQSARFEPINCVRLSVSALGQGECWLAAALLAESFVRFELSESVSPTAKYGDQSRDWQDC
jgi:hypothetical protein